nr:MAG TPA: Gifsy-2 prophage ATP-binding sugar transporter-like barrel, 4 helix bundle.7A [Bacteriophage sp.]
MSGFKDMVADDIMAVFLNLDEFAEKYRVEGKNIDIVVDNDELKKRQSGQDLAVAESATLFYARTEDLPHRRPAGESLNINGRECIIDDWQEDMGMSTVVLRQNIVG